MMRPPAGTMVPLGFDADTGVQFSAWEYSGRPGRWALLVMTPQGSFVSLEQWPSWEAAKAALEADDDSITWWSM